MCVPDIVPSRKETFADVVVYASTKSTSSLTRHLIFFLVGCPFLLYVIVGAYPTNIS